MPIEHKTYITPQDAIVLYRKSGFGNIGKVSVVAWVKKYELGLKIGGRWKIDKVKFEKFLREGTDEKA